MADKVKLTEAGRKVLESCVKFGNPMHHIIDEWGRAGWGGTRAALQHRGFLDESCRITEAGRAHLASSAKGD